MHWEALHSYLSGFATGQEQGGADGFFEVDPRRFRESLEKEVRGHGDGCNAGSDAFRAWRVVPPERIALYQRWIILQREVAHQWPRPADSVRLSEAPALEPFLAAHPARSLVLSTAGGIAAVENWSPRQISIHVHSPSAARLTIGHFYYADWRAHIGKESAAVTPSPDGLLQVAAPRGDYTLRLDLIQDKPERAGIWISALSLLVILILAATHLRGSPLGSYIQPFQA